MINSLLSLSSQHNILLHPSRDLFAKHLSDYIQKCDFNVNVLNRQPAQPVNKLSSFWTSDLIFIQKRLEIFIPSRNIINFCFNGYHQIVEHFNELVKVANLYPEKNFYLLIFEDTAELLNELAPLNLFIATFRFPFFPVSTEVEVTERTIIQLCGECKFAYLRSFATIIEKFEEITSIKIDLDFQNYSYLLHQEYRLYLFNTIIRKLDSNNYSHFLAIHRQLSTSLCDWLRLKLATSSKIYDKATAPIYIIGNDFVDSGCCQTALPTDFSQSIFSGNFCLDPSSHTLHTPFYFRPFQTILSGGIPIPVGFTYPHVQSDFNIMSITNEDDLLLLKSSLVKNLGKTFRCSITPPR